jgi:hypothetical protein
MGKSYRRRGDRQYGRKIRVRVAPTKYMRKGRTIERRGYTYLRGDFGLPGRGPTIIPVERGRLSRFGYSTGKSDQARRAALKEAIDEYGALSVFRKLNAMVIMRKRTQPEARAIFEEDRDWVRDQYKVDGFVS